MGLFSGEIKNMAKLLIGGDILPTEINISQFENGRIEDIIDQELLQLLAESDYRVFNLEGCFTDSETKIEKTGPNLKASVKSFRGFNQLGIDLVCLANNHIMDYDINGLKSTINLLHDAGISWCGAGMTIEEAYKAHILLLNGQKIGIIALAEHEFTIADNNYPGAAAFDDLESPDYINATKQHVDYLIVLYHGGKEYYRYPTPYVQKRCRKLVEKGANLVITQHSHCIGCMEKYLDGTIIYGQGNFLLSRGKDNELRRTGLIIHADTDNNIIDYDVVVKDGPGVRLATQDETKTVLKCFQDRSKEIKKDGFVEDEYSRFAKNNIEFYQRQSVGKIAVYLQKLHAQGIISKLFEREHLFGILNTMRCEAHRDLYIRGLIERLKR